MRFDDKSMSVKSKQRRRHSLNVMPNTTCSSALEESKSLAECSPLSQKTSQSMRRKAKSIGSKPIPEVVENCSSSITQKPSKGSPQAIGSKPIPEVVENCLKGMTFTLSGTLDGIEREDAIQLIKFCGGKVMKSLGKNCDYLIAGRDPGIIIQLALSLDKTVLNQQQFFDLIQSKGKAINDQNIHSNSTFS